MIDRYAAFGHHFFQIAVAEPVAAVPPDRPQDDFTGEMTTGEDAHGCDYFTQVFLSPELCNSTLCNSTPGQWTRRGSGPLFELGRLTQRS